MQHQNRSIRGVVLLAITAAVLTACSQTVPAQSPAPSPTAVGLPSGVSYTNEGPLGAGSASEPALAGTYQSRAFKPVVRFTVPAGWAGGSLIRTALGSSETRDGLPIRNGTGGIVLTVPTSIEPPIPGDLGAAVPADLFAWIQANPNLKLGPALDVTVAGIPGRAVEGTLSASARLDPVEQVYRMVDFLPLLPRQTFRLAVFVIDGQQLIVATIANSADFVAFSATADSILATLTLPDR